MLFLEKLHKAHRNVQKNVRLALKNASRTLKKIFLPNCEKQTLAYRCGKSFSARYLG
jgi:hypothetical protein